LPKTLKNISGFPETNTRDRRYDVLPEVDMRSNDFRNSADVASEIPSRVTRSPDGRMVPMALPNWCNMTRFPKLVVIAVAIVSTYFWIDMAWVHPAIYTLGSRPGIEEKYQQMQRAQAERSSEPTTAMEDQ
jgi:hypothetical protein